MKYDTNAPITKAKRTSSNSLDTMLFWSTQKLGCDSWLLCEDFYFIKKRTKTTRTTYQYIELVLDLIDLSMMFNF
jgi:hypothetical protein